MNLLLLFGVVANVVNWLPDNVTQFWVEPERPVAFKFTAQVDHNIQEENSLNDVQYILKTNDGAMLTDGIAKLDGDKLSIETTLPQGYFELEIPATEQTFGVASQPAFFPEDAIMAEDAKKKNGLRERDSFFAIDSASTWLVRNDKARDELLANAKRMGLATYRERVSWGTTEPVEGSLNYNGDRNAEKAREIAYKYDIPVLELFHDAPSWTGKIGKFPRDLNKTAASWGKISKRWNKYWNSFEIWNEPDISFSGNLPADQYVPVLKTVAQELAREGVSTPIVGGIIASFNDSYMDTMAENGALNACDIFSFHTYCRAYDMEAVMMRYHEWLVKNRVEWKPVWITECGRPWKKGTSRPNGEADMDSAIDIVQKGIAAKALGIDAYFPFVYVYYEENDNNFGMSDRNNAPLRSAAGYARSIFLLSGKRCVGSLEHDGVERAYVFRGEDGEQIVAFYSRFRNMDRKLRIPGNPLWIERVTGERVVTGAEGIIDFSDGFLFVAYPADAKLTLKAPTDVDKARELRRASRVKHGADPRTNYDIVARFDYDEKSVEVNGGGYVVKDPNASEFVGKISIFNFSENDKTLPITAECAVERDGDYVVLDNAFTVLPRQVVVPARGCNEIEFTLKLEGLIPFDKPKLSFGFGEDSNLIFSLSRSVSGENFDSMVEEVVPVSLSDITSWRVNASSHKKFEFLKDLMDEGNWGFSVDFNEGDRWAYPIFKLPQERTEDGRAFLVVDNKKYEMSKFKGVAFNFKATTSVSEDGVVRVFTYTPTGTNYYFSAMGVGKTDGKEHFVVVPFYSLSLSGAAGNGFDLNMISGISVGGNSKGDKMRIEVKDFRFFK